MYKVLEISITFFSSENTWTGSYLKYIFMEVYAEALKHKWDSFFIKIADYVSANSLVSSFIASF